MPDDMIGQPLRIGQLAAELGLNPKTIRYYEEIRLLPPPRRSPAGYRLYEAADRDRLRFIVKARGIGLRLAEIRDLLALHEHGESPCHHLRTVVDRKLMLLEAHICALLAFRDELRTLRLEAIDIPPDEACICGVIERHEPAHAVEAASLFPFPSAALSPSLDLPAGWKVYPPQTDGGRSGIR